MSRVIAFATSNRGKVGEAEVILRPFGLRVSAFDGKGDEIQADTVSEVAAHAAKIASEVRGKAVLVEDAGLFVDALSGFPGPYSSYVFRTIGLTGVLDLLRGKPRRGAVFRSGVAYCEPGSTPKVFEGAVRGRLVEVPRGKRGFGFDPLFVPSGATLTLAEMTLEEKCAVSHRGDALRKFGAWFSAD